jgi:hypothetical protein
VSSDLHQLQYITGSPSYSLLVPLIRGRYAEIESRSQKGLWIIAWKQPPIGCADVVQLVVEKCAISHPDLEVKSPFSAGVVSQDSLRTAPQTHRLAINSFGVG